MYKTLKNTLVISSLLLSINTLFANSDDIKTIRFNTFGDISNIDSSDFLDKNPEIELEVISNHWAGHHNALFEHLLFGDDWGDLITVDSSMLGRVINRVDLLDLEKLNVEGVSDIPSEIKIKGRSLSGGLQSLPLTLGISTLFYRDDVIAQNSTSIENVISDWESFIEFGRKLKSDNIKLINNANSIISVIIESDLGDDRYLYFNNQLTLNVKNKRVLRAFELAKIIHEEGLSLETGLWNDNWYESFRENNATVFSELNGEWLIRPLKTWIASENSGVWKLSVLPENDAGIYGGFDIVIPSSTKYPSEIKSYINYLFEENNILERFMNFGFFPANKSLYSNVIFDQKDEFFGDQRIYQAVIKNADNLSSFKSTPYDYYINLKIQEAFVKVINDEMTIDEALEEVEVLTKELINKTQSQAGKK